MKFKYWGVANLWHGEEKIERDMDKQVLKGKILQGNKEFI